MTIIRKIILLYDIILVQEIVSRDESYIHNLLHSINSLSSGGVTYNMALSDRLGRSIAKEQYAFFYKKHMFSVLDTDIYPDVDDNFMRPPYIVHFFSPTIKNLTSFIAVGIHVQPNNAANEISFLANVYDYVKNKYKNKNAIIMGDLNAGCSYIKTGDWKNISLWMRNEFIWLIGNHVDTTTNINSCPYDRIVIAGEEMKQAVINDSANILNFQNKYELTLEETTSVSDHWPVEVKLRGKLSKEAEIYLETFVCFTISDNRIISDPTVIQQEQNKFDFKTSIFNDHNGNYVRFNAFKRLDNLEDLLESFKFLTQKFPDVFNPEMWHSVYYKAKNGALNDDSSFTELNSLIYSINIDCDLRQLTCSTLTCRQTTIN
ncbi:deoxyribonuclease gamma-like isoform X1 [Centruroides sculpturatus]|uniref:deoxyribonuclease gamma-like isoform X1 n=2 Tax=Centruroides sculpturatus TaxID=218467 RepID=UPI000C6DCE33|nr:deoxyribonuclease gamma-like isoform X1 [Centruroides sculpturatus]XP_023216028.1 deoxyribonuclease gamma-like isoform X1 [Centruroides sculpturatus]